MSAIRLARGFTGREMIIKFAGNYHGHVDSLLVSAGSAAATLGVPSSPGVTKGTTQDTIVLEYNDVAALETAFAERGAEIAGVIFEPIVGNMGVVRPSEAFCEALQKLTREHGALLIYDEVQCGAGRTGKLFAHQWADTEDGKGAEPDIMAVAKGVGGGFPLGACIATETAAAGMVPGTHGSTYGGNPLAMAVGNAVWDEISKPEFLEHVTRVSNFLKQQFEGLKDEFPDVVDELRGKGLLCGMRLKKPALAVRKLALDKGLLGGSAGDNVLRLAPPLIITEDHVREAIGILRECFTEARELDDV
jgi:acetylornithine/N-succinyldiaminopimelate aminotransferase